MMPGAAPQCDGQSTRDRSRRDFRTGRARDQPLGYGTFAMAAFWQQKAEGSEREPPPGEQ
jgi:hypothetical protein